jgi:hypothetical protein
MKYSYLETRSHLVNMSFIILYLKQMHKFVAKLASETGGVNNP